jgi:DNA processing protein
MTAVAGDGERFARIALSFVAEPGDLTLGALLRACDPAGAFAAICDGRPPDSAMAGGRGGIPGLGRAIGRWAARLGAVPAGSRLAAWERAGMRIVCPGDPEWPTQLDVLGDARPLVLWLRGSAAARLPDAAARSGFGTGSCQRQAAVRGRSWPPAGGPQPWNSLIT